MIIPTHQVNRQIQNIRQLYHLPINIIQKKTSPGDSKWKFLSFAIYTRKVTNNDGKKLEKDVLRVHSGHHIQ